jgi:membrane associated rhomboid family serine protease
VTRWVLRLLLANVAVHLVAMSVPAVYNLFAFVPALILSRPWSPFTYMFLHDPSGLQHILFNMLGLYFFGPVVESRLGSRHFLRLYFVSGLTGALLSALFMPQAPVIGASGAIFGIELAFAYFWPRQPIYIWGILPIEARWMVVIMTVLALFGGASGRGSGGIAHFAHLGGFLGGYLYLKWMERQAPVRQFRQQMRPPAPRIETGGQAVERWSRIRRDGLHEVNRDELDRILDKISATGVGSLTPAEREFLDRFSARS